MYFYSLYKICAVGGFNPAAFTTYMTPTYIATGTYGAFQSSCVVGGNIAKTVRDFAQMHDETIKLGILFEY